MSPPKGHQSPSAPGRGAAESGASCGFLSPGGPRNMAGGGVTGTIQVLTGKECSPWGGGFCLPLLGGLRAMKSPGSSRPRGASRTVEAGDSGHASWAAGEVGPSQHRHVRGGGCSPPPPVSPWGSPRGPHSSCPRSAVIQSAELSGTKLPEGTRATQCSCFPPFPKAVGRSPSSVYLINSELRLRSIVALQT